MSAFNHHAQLALSRARPGLAKLAVWLTDLAGLGERSVLASISRETRLVCLRLLRPAEALARRLIVAMVIDLIADETFRSSVRRPTSGETAPRQSFVHTPERQTPVRTPLHAPGFRLFETIPSFAACFSLTAPTPIRRLTPRILDLSKPLPGQQDAPETAGKADPVLARIQALGALVGKDGEPLEASAHRLARRILRSRPYKRCNPLRPGFPPGSRSRHTPDWMQDALLHLAREIRRAPLLRPPPFEPSI